MQDPYDGMPKILVFGGNGFIGSRVCEEALSTGLQVVSINRSGRPKQDEPWMNEVQWFKVSFFYATDQSPCNPSQFISIRPERSEWHSPDMWLTHSMQLGLWTKGMVKAVLVPTPIY